MIQAINGPNFSGKSFYLQCYSQFPTEKVNCGTKLNTAVFHDARRDLYIGPIPSNFMSGLFSTVEEEIHKYKGIEQSINSYIESIDLKAIFSRNPFTLSGGEQAMVTALSFATSQPRALCIDSILEQLSLDWKISLLRCLINSSIPEVIIADNRLSELPSSLVSTMEYTQLEEHRDLTQFPDIDSRFVENTEYIHRHVLQLKNFNFSYGNKSVLKNINTEFESGYIYHLKGPNGSGKSTLAKILSGVIKPNTNRGLFLNGNNFKPYSHPGKYVGYSFQQPDDQLFSTKVYSELGLTKLEKRTALNSIVEAFGISKYLDIHPFDLPLSMRKRLSIVATLTMNQPFIILDEPNLYIDDNNITEVKSILETLAKCGKCIILISHSSSFMKLFKNIQTVELHKT